jgi:hypothetical protein
MRRNTVSNQQCLQKKNYKTKFLISLILKKNQQINYEKSKKKK